MWSIQSRVLVLGGALAILLAACGGGGGTAASASRAFGALDGTFGTGGRVVTDLGFSGSDAVSGMAIQGDGKIVVVGKAFNGLDDDFGVVRYDPDGSLDTTFGADGKVLTDFDGASDTAFGVAIQPLDQKIVVVGSVTVAGVASFGIVRYGTDGTLDGLFGTAGRVHTAVPPGPPSAARAVAIQSDRRIVVAGTAGASPAVFSVARYNADGSLDPSFNLLAGALATDVDALANGIAGGRSEAFDVALQNDQRIVVAGWADNGGRPQMALVRYLADGTLDTTFEQDGIVTHQVSGDAVARAVVVQPDGKLLAAGRSRSLTDPSRNEFALVRLTINGLPDSAFNATGVVTTAIGAVDDEASDLAIDGEGRIIAVGHSHDGTRRRFALVRYTGDGSLDSVFGSGGTQTTALGSGNSEAGGVGIQGDQRLVVAGTAVGTGLDFAAARYIP